MIGEPEQTVISTKKSSRANQTLEVSTIFTNEVIMEAKHARKSGYVSVKGAASR